MNCQITHCLLTFSGNIKLCTITKIKERIEWASYRDNKTLKMWVMTSEIYATSLIFSEVHETQSSIKNFVLTIALNKIIYYLYFKLFKYLVL